ncbi:MAG: hypothetical protein RMY16_18500 [Nostoc sp. DedQUE12b]|uniref:hypothetical protein n=1 Tax=Nostoc sp. DedQUE12b TaxID=3075398 RepID=UPI002AD4504E|nr:hypothetical protein [Nostoc sp. DedQUE12b]MDZ8087531.1 hypothetical protein [Nostoc sp. DedQUE12b]
MHKVSQQTIQTAQKHAQELIEQSKAVKELGESLQTDDQSSHQKGKRIKDCGESMEKQAHKVKDLTARLAEDASTEVFTEAVQEHINLTQTHIEAIKEFQKTLPLPKRNRSSKECE